MARENEPVVACQDSRVVRCAGVGCYAIRRDEEDAGAVIDGIRVFAQRDFCVRDAKSGGNGTHGVRIARRRVKGRVKFPDVVPEHRCPVMLRVDAHQQHAGLLRHRQIGKRRSRPGEGRECGGTNVRAAREAEEHQRPSLPEKRGVEWLAVLVGESDLGKLPRRSDLSRVRGRQRRTLPATDKDHADGRRYNRDGSDQQRACGHGELRGDWIRKGDDYPTSIRLPMTAPRAFARDPPSDASVAELIRFGAAEFEHAGLVFGHGTGTALDDAAALAFHALGLDHDRAAEAYDLRPNASARAAVLALFAERIGRRIPSAYLMGRMWFAGLEFEIDPRVIVPRSPFAELILGSFRPWVDPDRVRRVLDLGTGSGCIAIACALALPHTTVDAVDISPEALEIARRNVARHSVADRVQLLAGDLYAPVLGRRYDLILSNPPYVSDSEMAQLPAEYAHEPELALRAGTDGLHAARRILADAARHLEADGTLFVEVGDSDARLETAFPELPFVWLQFEHGGGGVFRLTRTELEANDAVLKRRSKHVG